MIDYGITSVTPPGTPRAYSSSFGRESAKSGVCCPLPGLGRARNIQQEHCFGRFEPIFVVSLTSPLAVAEVAAEPGREPPDRALAGDGSRISGLLRPTNVVDGPG